MTLLVEPVPTQSVPTGPTPTQPVPNMTEHVLTMTQHVLIMPKPTINECTPTMPRPFMNEHAPITPRHFMPVHTMNEHTLTTPRPTVPVPGGLALTASMSIMSGHTMPIMSDSTVPMHAVPMHTMSQPTVSGPTLPEGKPQTDMSSIGVHISTPPAPVVTQPQVVLVKQFQPPKPYTGASLWKSYRKYFER